MDCAVFPLVAMAIAFLVYAVALGEAGKARRRTRAFRDQEAARMRGLHERIEGRARPQGRRSGRLPRPSNRKEGCLDVIRLADSPEETKPTVMNRINRDTASVPGAQGPNRPEAGPPLTILEQKRFRPWTQGAEGVCEPRTEPVSGRYGTSRRTRGTKKGEHPRRLTRKVRRSLKGVFRR
jgi:hypothetical protein